MKFNILTLFPQMINDYLNYSILKRACENNLISVNAINPRDFTTNKHKKVDDTVYGGAAGMLLQAQPFVDALNSVEKEENSETIIMSPDGEIYNQKMAFEFSKLNSLNIICGHYEGFDERIKIITKARPVSMGDYIITGGELGALSIIDSVSRLIPEVLGKVESFENESFSEYLLEAPQYTKPREFMGYKVPEVLLNGNHKEIYRFKRIEQIKKTKELRPDLFEKFLESDLSKDDVKLLTELKLL